MQAKEDQAKEAGPTPITVEYADGKGQTQRRGFKYGSGEDRQGFYDGVKGISEDMSKGKKKE